jgi:hypothetical protein
MTIFSSAGSCGKYDINYMFHLRAIVERLKESQIFGIVIVLVNSTRQE